MSTFRTVRQIHQTLCVYEIDTPDSVVFWLENCIKEHLRGNNKRVRIFYGDTDYPNFEKIHGRTPNPGHVWQEEYDVSGYIGKSTGEKPIPLMLANSRSSGGGGLLDGCIVRMIVDGYEVYRHPNYQNDMDKAEIVPSDLAGYSHNVTANGEIHARFHSLKSAQRWLSFMQGNRMTK